MMSCYQHRPIVIMTLLACIISPAAAHETWSNFGPSPDPYEAHSSQPYKMQGFTTSGDMDKLKRHFIFLAL